MVRRTSDVVDVGTSATKVYSRTASGVAKIKKVHAHNTGTADVTFYFCTSGGTRKTPNILVLAGQTVFVSERELPSTEWEEDIYAIASAATLQLQIEVEE